MNIKTGFLRVFAKIMVFCGIMMGVFYTARADEITCPAGQILHTYESVAAADVPAGVQNGTPSPTNPIEPMFYKQGDMVLRRIGGYADSYDATTGKITRRIGVKVLTGNENPTYNAMYHVFSVAQNLLSGEYNNLNNSIISTHFKQVGYNPTDVNGVGFIFYTQVFLRYMDYDNDVAGLKNWLRTQYNAGTPVTIYYPLETPYEEDWAASYCQPPIKIATNAYNDAQFSPVVANLNSAVATIKNVVANTITQTAAIAEIASDKQTRPDSGCPQFRQCLLVEDEDGTPHWYQIKDPVHDLVLSLKNNKVNSAGETTTTAFAADGYDGTTDSRYYNGYSAMRQLADGLTSVYNRQFTSAMLNGANGGQYKTLGDQEWAVTWQGNETGTANSFLPGVIYGTSRCAKTIPSSTAVGTAGWNTIENSDPLNDAANIQEYTNCYCKMTGVGIDGEITPVKNSSTAPWVFVNAGSSAAYCARGCAYFCAFNVRGIASFRQSIMNWAVQ